MKKIITLGALMMIVSNFAFSQIKILPLGESTTDFGPSYRRKLCELLANFGSKYDMVGPKNDGATNYDGDHAGYSGNPSDQVQLKLQSFASTISADVVLIWEGTNDCGWASTNGDTTNLGRLVDKVIQLYPNAQVFVGSIPPMSYNAYESQEHGRKPGIAQANGVTFNKNLPSLVSRRASAGKKVYYVDATSMTLEDVSSDGIHPNQQGYDKMGNFFFDALKKTVLDVQKPSIPTNLAAANIANNTLTLSWNASTDNLSVAGYDVFKNGVFHGSSNTTTMNVIGMGSGQMLKFKVLARDGSGNLSDFSSEISVTMRGNPDKVLPSIPSNLAAQSIAGANFILTWSAATDNDVLLGYEIFRDDVLLGFVSASETKFTVGNLIPSVSYTMTVRAKDASENVSPKSSPLVVKTLEGMLKYEAEDALLAGGTKKASNHTGFSGLGFVDSYESQGASTTFNVGVGEAANYIVSLRYCNSMGSNRTFSVYVNGVKVKQTSMPSLSTWDTWAFKSETLSLAAGANKIAYVFENNDLGFVNIDYVEIAKATITAVEATQLDAISIYPNPVTAGVIHVNISKLTTEVSSLVLYNIIGTKVLSIIVNTKNNPSFELPSELPSGVYMLEVNGGDKKYLKKLVVE